MFPLTLEGHEGIKELWKRTMAFEAEPGVCVCVCVGGCPYFLLPVPLRIPRVIYSKEDCAVVKITQNPFMENPQVPGLACWSHKHICLRFSSPCTTRHTDVFIVN